MSKFDPYEHLKLRLNPDGTISRLADFPTVEANPEPIQDVQTVCKDITINPDTKLWVRLYLPVETPSEKGLPVVVFFHGGGFIYFNAHDQLSHNQCVELCYTTPALVVNVDYRRVPEHRLPSQYDDGTEALRWVQQQAMDPSESDPWMRDHADFSRCYIYGRGNGGNIAYHVAFRAMDMDLNPLEIVGVAINQPMFGGVKRVGSELGHFEDHLLPLPAMDVMWELSLPKGTTKDHRYSNPMADEQHRRKVGALPKCLVIGFRGDPMFDRQEEFVKMLVKGGVNVEACFDDVGFHGVDVVDPQRAEIVLRMVNDFINR